MIAGAGAVVKAIEASGGEWAGMGPATFDRRQFPPELLADAKRGRFVSVCLPARNEEQTVGAIAARLCELGERFGVVDEVLVVDDGSTDGTAAAAKAAGATVVAANDVVPEHGPGTGKGEALWKAVQTAKGDLLVFCDADIRRFDPRFVTGLLGPLLLHDGIDFVKGAYERDGGRVTELVARPLISLLFPHLAGFVQPLAGEFAARREVLEAVPFVQGYGVDLALLIDVVAAIGMDRVAQVHLGERVHRNRPLAELGPEASAVMQAGLNRAGLALAVPERPPPCRLER